MCSGACWASPCAHGHRPPKHVPVAPPLPPPPTLAELGTRRCRSRPSRLLFSTGHFRRPKGSRVHWNYRGAPPAVSPGLGPLPRSRHPRGHPFPPSGCPAGSSLALRTGGAFGEGTAAPDSRAPKDADGPLGVPLRRDAEAPSSPSGLHGAQVPPTGRALVGAWGWTRAGGITHPVPELSGRPAPGCATGGPRLQHRRRRPPAPRPGAAQRLGTRGAAEPLLPLVHPVRPLPWAEGTPERGAPTQPDSRPASRRCRPGRSGRRHSNPGPGLPDAPASPLGTCPPAREQSVTGGQPETSCGHGCPLLEGSGRAAGTPCLLPASRDRGLSRTPHLSRGSHAPPPRRHPNPAAPSLATDLELNRHNF